MKIVIISGASSGIGLATTKKLIEENYKVIGLARNFDKTDFEHPNFTKVILDIRDTKAIQSFAKGTEKVDILINNAGVGYFNDLEKLKIEQIQEMVETNLLGMIFLTRAFLPKLKESKGKIINIASDAGQKGEKWGTIYCATKFAVRGFSESLLAETRKNGVAVTCLYPGMVRNSFYKKLSFQPTEKKGKILSSLDVAQVIVKLITLEKGILIPEITLQPQTKRIEWK